MSGRRSHRRPRELIACLLAVAFALRALLPHGFMPGAEPFSLKLCPAGLAVRTVDARALAPAPDVHAAHHAHDGHAQAHTPQASSAGAHESHDSHQQSAAQCPFGAAALAIALPHLATTPLNWVGLDVPAPDPRTVSLDKNHDYRPQPRGPPALS